MTLTPQRAYIADLSDVRRSDARQVGAKAANLGDLARAGFPVPDGFVVTTDAFRQLLEANGLDGESRLETVAGAPIPPGVEAAIRDAANALGDAPVAVRSSGVAEDLPGASFAGQYETVLDVRGADAVTAAVRRCWASAFDPRVAAYRRAQGREAGGMAVLVQRLVSADAAGVAFTANPVSGDRAETLVSAVRGLGERLVSGQATPDEWLVRGDEVTCRAAPEGAITADQVRAVAALARRVEQQFGGAPQDVEWAIQDGALFLLQARPITALPDPVEWCAPLPGTWLRHFRLGEWLGDPVTPLFESWLLTRLEERLHANYRKYMGFRAPHPLHVIVNGWYFYGFNLPQGAAMLRTLVLHVLPRLLVQPRRVAMMMPQTAHFGIELWVREWRESLLPRHLETARRAAARVEAPDLRPRELIALVDELADVAGDYFTSITSVAGFAAKAEFPLATFYKQHLYPRIGGSHQRLLVGLYESSPGGEAHAVESLDWATPTLGERAVGWSTAPLSEDDRAERRARLDAERRAAEAEARTVLANEPKRLATFERLLATAQRFQPLRDEQVAAFTVGWPTMRRAVLRLGALLADGRPGALAVPEDIFFLTLPELHSAFETAARLDLAGLVAGRRETWQRQRRLSAPPMLGDLPPMMEKILVQFDQAIRMGGATPRQGLQGVPASPGRVTGPARVIRGFEDFDRLRPGEVLVAPLTTPAWTPLFARAAAVVTDSGGLGSHSSIVAREFGIPAVIGVGDATKRLRDGQVITVDGNAGFVAFEAEVNA